MVSHVWMLIQNVQSHTHTELFYRKQLLNTSGLEKELYCVGFNTQHFVLQIRILITYTHINISQ
jgi:hypothetical protein